MNLSLRKLSKALVSTVAAVAGLVGGVSAPAGADSGAQRFHIGFEGSFTEAMTTDWPVVASGVVRGRGVQKLVSEGPGPSPGTVIAVAELTFPTGSITLELRAAIEDDRYFGPNNCYNTKKYAGEYRVLAGTGSLAGASGHGTGRSRSTLFVPPSSDGCSFIDCRVGSHIELSGWITIPENS